MGERRPPKGERGGLPRGRDGRHPSKAPPSERTASACRQRARSRVGGAVPRRRRGPVCLESPPNGRVFGITRNTPVRSGQSPSGIQGALGGSVAAPEPSERPGPRGARRGTRFGESGRRSGARRVRTPSSSRRLSRTPQGQLRRWGYRAEIQSGDAGRRCRAEMQSGDTERRYRAEIQSGDRSLQ